MRKGFCKSYQEDQCDVIYPMGSKHQARRVVALHSFRFFFPPDHLHDLAHDVVYNEI